MLLIGWDNASHFAMFFMHRVHGVAPPLTPPSPDASPWYFSNYPQLHHSLLGLIAELGYGSVPGGAPEELLRYTRVTAVLFVALTVVMVAAVLQLPEIRYSRGVAIVSVIVVWSLVLGAPGAPMLLDGHISFLESAIATGMIGLLAVGLRDEHPVLLLAVLGALLVVVAQWLLLLPVALVAAAGPAWGAVVRPRCRRPPGIFAVVLIGVGVAGLCTFIAGTYLGSAVGEHLTLEGGVFSTVPASAVVVPLAGVAVACALLRRSAALRSTSQCSLSARRIRRGSWILGALSVVGLAGCLALATFQLVSGGSLTYYFWKLSVGVQTAVILTAIPPVAANLLTIRRFEESRARTPSPAVSHRVRSGLAAGAVVGASTLGLGFSARLEVLPSVIWPITANQRLQEAGGNTTGASRILTAAALVPGTASTQAGDSRAPQPPEPASLAGPAAANTTLVATLPDDPNSSLANAWFHALTVSRTNATAGLDIDLHTLTQQGRSRSAVAHAIEAALQADNGVVLVTDPFWTEFVAGFQGADGRDRVLLTSAR